MTTPIPTSAQIQARANALTNSELKDLEDAAVRAADHLFAALIVIAAGWGRGCLKATEQNMLRESPHRNVRQAGARRLVAARLLSKSNELIVSRSNELIVKQTNFNEKKDEEPVNWEKAFNFLAKMTCTGFVSSDEVSERVRVLRDFVDPRAADRVVEIFNKKRSKFLQEFMG